MLQFASRGPLPRSCSHALMPGLAVHPWGQVPEAIGALQTQLHAQVPNCNAGTAMRCKVANAEIRKQIGIT